MDYEKKYNEALNQAKFYHGNCPSEPERKKLEKMFPELKESDDERVRKSIIRLLQVGGYMSPEDKEKAYAWLENQPTNEEMLRTLRAEYEKGVADTIAKYEIITKEPCKENANSFTSEDERICKDIIQFFRDASNSKTRVINSNTFAEWAEYLEKQKHLYETAKDRFYREGFEEGQLYERQKEQKPAEWSEEYREEDLRTRFAFYTYKDEDSVLYLSNVFVEETSRNKGFGTKILAAAEKVAETLGAIQIRLKAKQDSPANAWYRKHGYGYMAFEDGYDWLEKNLEYMKPIKSEWKPSEAEVKALEGVYLFWRGATNRTPDIRSLELLYDDLKKL